MSMVSCSQLIALPEIRWFNCIKSQMWSRFSIMYSNFLLKW
jgi:hypothetical protein